RQGDCPLRPLREHMAEAVGRGVAYDFVIRLGYTSTQAAKRDPWDHLAVWAEFRVDGADMMIRGGPSPGDEKTVYFFPP
ncbi:MAG TPA: hypothetical protein VGB25_00775, partial [Candidatus Binatia bacterium]